MCQALTRFVGDIFEQLEENPDVQLNGMMAFDEAWFKWVRKFREEGRGDLDALKAEVYGKCRGTRI